MLIPNEKMKSPHPLSSGWLSAFEKTSARVKEPVKNIYSFVRGKWFAPSARFGKNSLNNSTLVAKIGVLHNSLQELFKKIEPKFIRLGQKLQTVYADSKGLGQLTVNAAQTIAGGSEDSLLARIGNLARQSLEDLRYSQKEIDQSLEKVDQGVAHLAGLYRMCSAIDKTAMVLHVVGLNIAVESCASLESRTMFQVFAEEIKQLSRKINAISQNIRDDSSQASNNQLLDHQKILEGLAQLQTLTTAAEKTVVEAVERINQLMALSFEGLEKAGHISREISHQTGEIVVSIQFHDISRQQMEHIADALKDAENLLHDPNALSATKADRSRIMAKAHSILLLQLEQLKLVIAEIDNAHQKAETAFEKIGIEILNLVESLNPVDTGPARSEQELDPFLALKAGLENLQKLFNQGQGLSRQMEQIADHASQAASTLTKHIDQVRSISLDLHLKALNAVVKTAHLNDKGKTLEVLAQEVNRLSNQSITFVNNVVGVLESITYLSKALAEHTWNKTNAQSGAEGVKDSLTTGIEAITGAYNGFKADTQSIAKYSEDLESSIRQIRAELGFLSKLTARLNQHLVALQDLVTGLAPWSTEIHGTLGHEIKNLSERYTMQKERDIHNELFNNNATPLSPAGPTADRPEPVETAVVQSPAPEKDKKEEDFGSNVELF